MKTQDVIIGAVAKRCTKCKGFLENSAVKCEFCGSKSFERFTEENEQEIETSMARVTCPVCGREYRQDLLENCPRCASAGVVTSDFDDDESIHSSRSSSYQNRKTVKKAEKSSGDMDELLSQINEVRRAVNRATHAIRSIVLFVLWQLSFTTIAAVVYVTAVFVSNLRESCQENPFGCEPNAFLVFVALVIWVSGVIYSSRIAWDEIRKSNF